MSQGTDSTPPAGLGNLEFQDPETGDRVKMDSLWQDGPVLVHFLRRFGCQLCRLGASQLSAIKPQLDELNVRMVGVAPEQLGYEEFRDGKFWAGDVYVDEGKSAYKALSYKRQSTFWGILSLLSSEVRAGVQRTKDKGISGNFAEDGMQLGGTLLLGKGGSPVLYRHNQEGFVDYPSNAAILEALKYTERTGKTVPEEVLKGDAPPAAGEDCGCSAQQ